MNKGKLKSISLAFSLEQKIDGMCLKEGLSDSELSACEVQTVGDQKLLKRKIADLVGKSPLRLQTITFTLPNIKYLCHVVWVICAQRSNSSDVWLMQFLFKSCLITIFLTNSLSKYFSFHKK